MLEQLQHYSPDYQRWLYLNKIYASTPLSPSEEIDKEWHRHLETGSQYADFCQHFFGRILGHEINGIESSQEGFKNFQAIWKREFGSCLIGEPALCDRVWK